MNETDQTKTDQIKRKLEERLVELRAKAGEIGQDLRSSHSADWQEQAMERESDDMLESLENTTLAEIDSIRAALEKIEKGSYGLCESCGEDINPRRLEALPYATRCMNCAA